MKFNPFIFIIISVIIIILSQHVLLPDVLLLISFSAILFILYNFSKDLLFFLGGSITLFGSIGASSIGYNPYSIYTIIIFYIPVFLSIIFLESLVNESSGMKRITLQSGFSVLLSLLFIFVFGTYSIQERDILSLSILLVILIVALYYLLNTISSKE
ncbi:MAG: hypothetical protein ACP5R0_04080 [Thermoplasmata archaeon]